MAGRIHKWIIFILIAVGIQDITFILRVSIMIKAFESLAACRLGIRKVLESYTLRTFSVF